MRKDNELMLDVSQAHEFKLACRRVGVTNAEIKRLSEGDLLATLLPVIRGFGKVVITVDLDADPFLPKEWKVEEHIKGGKFEFDPKKIALHLDAKQIGGVIGGNELRGKLKGKPVFNANLLDSLLAYPNLIPEEWKSKAIYFWDTIYRISNGDLVVRYLVWRGGQWDWLCSSLGSDFGGGSPAAVPASE